MIASERQRGKMKVITFKSGDEYRLLNDTDTAMDQLMNAAIDEYNVVPAAGNVLSGHIRMKIALQSKKENIVY